MQYKFLGLGFFKEMLSFVILKMTVTHGSTLSSGDPQFSLQQQKYLGEKRTHYYEKPICNLNLISKLQEGVRDSCILMSKTVVLLLVASSLQD